MVVYIYSVHRYNIKAFKDNTGEKITSCRECRRRRAPSSLLVAIVKYDGGADETSSESVNGGCGWGGGVSREGVGRKQPNRLLFISSSSGRSSRFCVHVHTPFQSPPTHILPVIRDNVPYIIQF